MSLAQISLIDENYPVAGIDQSSNQFRVNFDNIKLALTDLDLTVVTVIDDLTDVDTMTVTPVTDDVMVFDGVKWVPGFANVVLDVTPELGGHLNTNGFNLLDGVEVVLSFAGTASSVNWIDVANAVTTVAPKVSAIGSDTNVDMILKTKGTSSVIIASDTANSRLAAIAGSSLEIATEDNVTGNGPNITIFAGSSTGAAGNGGSINLRHGAEDTTGTVGAVFIRDQSNDTIARFRGSTVGTGVNFFAFRNGTIGTPPAINSSGADVNINMDLNPKGTGHIRLSGLNYPIADAAAGYVMTTDGAGTLDFAASADLGEFLIASLPSAATHANSYALATDASGGRTIVRSDGVNWKIVAVEGATVS